MSAADNLSGQFLQRRHAQLMEGYNKAALERLHREVDLYHEAGHHNWTPEHSIALMDADPEHENDPYDTVPIKHGPQRSKPRCDWCTGRGLAL